jgi:hypothetical protein
MSNTELTGEISRGIRVVDAWRPLVIRVSRMKRALTGVFTGMARRALSSNRLCPMMHTGEGPFGVRLRTHNREVYHAYNQSVGGFDRGWRPAMAGEQLHTDGRFNQKDPEYRRSCCRGFMAFERFWDSPLPFQSPRVIKKKIRMWIMNRQIMLAARPVRTPRESDFIWVKSPVPVS